VRGNEAVGQKISPWKITIERHATSHYSRRCYSSRPMHVQPGRSQTCGRLQADTASMDSGGQRRDAPISWLP